MIVKQKSYPKLIFLLRFAVWCLWEDHLRVVSNSTPKRFLKDLKEILLFLEDIKKCLGGFLFDQELGFLAENADNNGFNFKIEVTAAINEDKVQTLKGFCLINKLIFNPGQKEIEGQLQKIRIRSKRISVLFEDIEVIGKVVKMIGEI